MATIVRVRVRVFELIYWPGQSRSRALAITQSELLGPQIFANEIGRGQEGGLVGLRRSEAVSKDCRPSICA